MFQRGVTVLLMLNLLKCMQIHEITDCFSVRVELLVWHVCVLVCLDNNNFWIK